MTASAAQTAATTMGSPLDKSLTLKTASKVPSSFLPRIDVGSKTTDGRHDGRRSTTTDYDLRRMTTNNSRRTQKTGNGRTCSFTGVGALCF